MKTTKNWTRRMVGLLLAFTLISTCLFAGTLAKYVTSASGSDTARVAKWGVAIDASAVDGLFKTTYAKDDSSYTLTADTVISSNSDKLVAPGTTGAMAGLSITGVPEVASRVSISVDTTASVLTGWFDASNAPYEPVLWTLKNGSGAVVGGASDVSFADLKTALNGVSVDLPPNTDLAASDLGYAVSWRWPFSTSSGNDIKDTFLGNKVPAPTITLKFDVTVTQID